MTDYLAQQAARASAAAAMQAAFPYLVPIAGKVDGLQAAGKNIRIELKAAFPGVKFSVKSSRFSMGDSISVSWTDGPIADQVDEIVNKYSAGSFNSMDDSYNYSRDAWKEAFGDAKYISTSRNSSDAAIASALRTVFARYADDLVGLVCPTVAEYHTGAMGAVYLGNDTVRTMVWRVASKRTWCLTKRAAVVAEEVAA